tara:strand:- start:1284 stop:1664 length:381 start_codon:yes stop_codon:yes gene_type:complete
MRIYGIGTDIVKVKRLKQSVKKKNFISKLFNQHEINKCKKTRNYLHCYAKRFAAKEAFSKALGTGISKGINFREIIVLNDKNGKPYIILEGLTKNNVKKKLKGKYKISLSLTDEDNYAVAFVTITV